jgi:nitroimidazol reductase NimA-like FMN-containing flavoprotein (pyridoxamine 5'-phosphate oxidase superfamily)
VSQLTAIENLSTDDCLSLLASLRIGRLAVAADEGVRIFPVNYLVDGDSIVIRSEVQTLVRFAPLQRVEFEVDDIDSEGGTGWAVVTDGTAQLLTDALDTASEHARSLTLPDWSHLRRPEWLRIVLTRIVGVRLVGDPSPDVRPVEAETPSPTGSDLVRRQLLEEVRTRLVALTQAHAREQADAETLRRGADELETIVRRLHWLADMTDAFPDGRPEPAW